MFSHFWNCLTLLDASGFDENGCNGRGTKWGINSMSTRWRRRMHRTRWVLCAVKRNHGRKEVLKHRTETNTAIQYGLFGCINHEATRNSTYEATLQCDRPAMLTVPPLALPPIPTVHPPGPLHSEWCSSALLVRNIVGVREEFTSYLSVCTLK